MTYAQALTPNNAMANNLSNSMNNIKLDTTVDPAETYMLIEKHHPKGGDNYEKTENSENKTDYTSYQPQAPVINQNYQPQNYSMEAAANQFQTQSLQQNFQPANQTMQTPIPQYSEQMTQTPVMQPQYQSAQKQTQPDYSQYYGQQYYTPVAQQYQAYQAPMQYAQTQNMPPAC